MFKEKPNRLEDVNIFDINPPPDPGIRKLVKVFRYLGYTTMGSCEGGLEGSRHSHPFPWVTIYGVGFESDPRHQQITAKLREFNQRSDVGWKTDWAAVQPEKAASNQGELQRLQDNADKLADFLFGE